MSNKTHLHFISTLIGSIGEITKDLLPFFEEEFIITKEWLGEIPEKRDILFCHFLDSEVMDNEKDFNSFKLKILIQPIDGTHIKDKVVDYLNMFDFIITPSNSGRKIMIKNKVTTPIKVIPNFYKPDIFEKVSFHPIEKYIPKNKIIFYHESTFHPRKGIELLYEGFTKAFADTEFADKVVLVLKDMPYTKQSFERLEDLKKETIKLQEKYKKVPQILKFSCFLNENELKLLWDKTDIYISLSKIEGFGIPMLRMFLLNKPIICLKNEHSGYLDYLNESNSYLIETTQKIAHEEFMWLYDEETEWAVPNIEDVSSKIKECFENYPFNKKCLQNSKDSREEYEKVYEKYALSTVSKQYIDFIKNSFKKYS